MVGMAGMDWGTFDREDFDAEYRDAMEAKHLPKQTAETEKEQVETRRVDCSCGESYYSDGTVPERHRDCPVAAIPVPASAGTDAGAATLRAMIGNWLDRADCAQKLGGMIPAVQCNTLRECARDLSAALGWPDDVRRA